MKKILSILLCYALCWSMLACSDDDDEPGNDNKNPEEQTGNNKTTADGKITGLPDELSALWGQGETDEWDGSSDISWYDESKTIFHISTAAQFAGFAELVNSGTTFRNKTVKLTVNLILNKKIEVDSNYKVTNASELREFTPIGKRYNNHFFHGIFDGGYHIISGLYINSSEYYTGLFNGIKYWEFDKKYSNLTIKNLGIVSSYIKGDGYASSITPSIDYFYNSSRIENCFNSGIVIGTWVYGIGHAGSIKNCFNTGTLVGKSVYGIGFAERDDEAGYGGASGEIEHCFNRGTLIAIAEGSACGIGHATNAILYSFNQGSINAFNGEGYGIGFDFYNPNYAYGFKIVHCYNSGKIKAKNCYGIGMYIYVNNCYNIGKLEPTELFFPIANVMRTYQGKWIRPQNSASLFQEELYNKYASGEMLFKDNAGELYFHDPDGELSKPYPEEYKTLLEALNYGLSEDVWKIDPEKNDGYPIFIE